ncbi:protein spire homolog 1 [Trichomycterus rosablanca]|uniref:protein spire homolog 1 n=1 Tax=Trichomycterus rosablanca TaxID=2290929 RepID=UPI002F353B90
MEWCGGAPGLCQLSLSEILGLQDQPMCEEQAWALCYQLCSLLEINFNTNGTLSYSSWKSFRLPGPEGVLLSPDGSISLTIETSKTEDQLLVQSEDQTVDYVGRLMYSCLDWGLDADVERELDETLEVLVGQMTKVDIRLDNEHCLQCISSISEVLQVCEERLYNPSQAAKHYRSVCSMLYSHTLELCHYLQVIQQSRENLQKMIMESESMLVPNVTTNFDFTWKHLIEELSRGVVLRPSKEKINGHAPVVVDTSPFSQLLQDIQFRRYKLRKVPAVEDRAVEQSYKSDPHQTLLNVIRSGPKLRPVSERNLKPRAPSPKHEVSLHELLMQEIRSTDKMKLLTSCRRRRSNTVDDCCSSLSSLAPTDESSSDDDCTFLNYSAPNSVRKEARCWERCTDGASHENSFTGAADRTPGFLPACSSTPVNLSEPRSLFRGKPRARSFAGNQELGKLAQKNHVPVPTTIADVIETHYSKERKSKVLCNANGNWRVCSCCAKRSFYFTWHNFCSLCSRVVCSACCVELLLPFKWCVNLPVGFFKLIVLDRGCEESRRNFWNERWTWDSSWVPLVWASTLPTSASSLTLAMRDWHSQEVCIECQDLLQEVFNSVPRCPIRVSQEI